MSTQSAFLLQVSFTLRWMHWATSGLRVLPKDMSTCRIREPGIKPPTFWLIDDPFYPPLNLHCWSILLRLQFCLVYKLNLFSFTVIILKASLHFSFNRNLYHLMSFKRSFHCDFFYTSEKIHLISDVKLEQFQFHLLNRFPNQDHSGAGVYPCWHWSFCQPVTELTHRHSHPPTPTANLQSLTEHLEKTHKENKQTSTLGF